MDLSQVYFNPRIWISKVYSNYTHNDLYRPSKIIVTFSGSAAFIDYQLVENESSQWLFKAILLKCC